MITPEEVCRLIRVSFVGSETVYTNGSCFRFYEILKGIFPQAKPWYDYEKKEGGHVYTEIDGKYYDIYGELTVGSVLQRIEPMSDKTYMAARGWCWDYEAQKEIIIQKVAHAALDAKM